MKKTSLICGMTRETSKLFLLKCHSVITLADHRHGDAGLF